MAFQQECLLVVLGYVILMGCGEFGVHGETIKWIGGSGVWSEPTNWDKGRVPLATDDVVINVPTIPVFVRVSTYQAECNSLVVGGNGQYPQSLTLQGRLTVGVGGAQIIGSGMVYYQGTSDWPLTSLGPFVANDNFIFSSGSLLGTGSFTFSSLNLTGPALKVINTRVLVTGTVNALPETTATLNILGGYLHANTFSSSYPLVITTSDGAQFIVAGTFTFNAAGSTATIRGYTSISNLHAQAGSITFIDYTYVETSTVEDGASVILGGAPSSVRNFGSIIGKGQLVLQAGNNSFSEINEFASVVADGGYLILPSKPSSVDSFTLSGGVISGSASLSISSLSVFSGLIHNTPVTADTIDFQGFITLSGGTLVISSTATLGQPSQLTLEGSAHAILTASATFSQTSSFKVLPSGSILEPLLTVNGLWTSTSDLQIAVTTQGTGSFELGSDSSTTITGVSFSAQSFLLNSPSSILNSLGSHITVGQVSGSGVVYNQGETFTVTSLISLNKFVQTTGTANFTTGNITALSLQSGYLTVTGPPVSPNPYLALSTLTFSGGFLQSTQSSNTITTNLLSITGINAHTFVSLTVIARTLSFKCPSQQCLIITNNAEIDVGS